MAGYASVSLVPSHSLGRQERLARAPVSSGVSVICLPSIEEDSSGASTVLASHRFLHACCIHILLGSCRAAHSCEERPGFDLQILRGNLALLCATVKGNTEVWGRILAGPGAHLIPPQCSYYHLQMILKAITRDISKPPC